MPYYSESNRIITKVEGVTKSEGITPRQNILQEMKVNPHKLNLIYLVENYVYCTINNSTFCVGEIKQEYLEFMKGKQCKVTSWVITGGHTVEMIIGKPEKASYGLNIVIDLNFNNIAIDEFKHKQIYSVDTYKI